MRKKRRRRRKRAPLQLHSTSTLSAEIPILLRAADTVVRGADLMICSYLTSHHLTSSSNIILLTTIRMR